MSLEKAVTDIKKLVEDDEIFRAASSDEVSRRPKDLIGALKEVVDTLELRVGFVRDDLRDGVINTDDFARSTAKKLRLYFESADRELKESGL